MEWNEWNAAPSSQKLRGKLKWNPIKRISLFAFDGWNGRVGLALLWGVKGCCCSRAPQRERPAQPNNPSTIHISLWFLFSYFYKSNFLSWPPQFMNLWMNEGVRRGSPSGVWAGGQVSCLLGWLWAAAAARQQAKRETSWPHQPLLFFHQFNPQSIQPTNPTKDNFLSLCCWLVLIDWVEWWVGWLLFSFHLHCLLHKEK